MLGEVCTRINISVDGSSGCRQCLDVVSFSDVVRSFAKPGTMFGAPQYGTLLWVSVCSTLLDGWRNGTRAWASVKWSGACTEVEASGGYLRTILSAWWNGNHAMNSRHVRLSVMSSKSYVYVLFSSSDKVVVNWNWILRATVARQHIYIFRGGEGSSPTFISQNTQRQILSRKGFHQR